MGNSEDRLLTIAEIAQELKLPESTVRYYRDRFADFIPTVGRGRGRKYKPEALEVLRFIAEGLRNDLTATEVAEAVSRIFPISATPSAEPQQTAAATQREAFLALVEAQGQAMRQVAAALERIATQGEETAALRREVEALREEVAQLRNERKRRPWWEFFRHRQRKED